MNGIVKKLNKWWKKAYFTLFYKHIFNNFQFHIYQTKSLREFIELYKLRYQVYCEEYGYIDKCNYPDHLESDEYDKYSDYFVIRDKAHQIAATVRVIRNSEAGFPIEKHFKLNIDTFSIDRNKLAEISRLIVAKKYRKKMLLLFLIKGLYLYAQEQKVTHAYFVIDEKLYPLLRSLSIPINIIGEKSLYQGITFPCIVDIAEWVSEAKRNKQMRSFFYHGGIELDAKHKEYVIH